MASAEASCYTIIYEDSSETPSTQDLRTALQKGSDEVKLDTLRKIIVSTINGNHQVYSTVQGGGFCALNLGINAAATAHAHNPICHAVAE